MKKYANKEMPNTIGKVMSMWLNQSAIWDADGIKAIDILYSRTKHDSWWFSSEFDAWARDNKITTSELYEILK